jgi:NAD(P)-dependent dehydrogenase (short-subunit alcohol dehydrogenase family)
MREKNLLIVGGTSGIGQALVKQLAEQKHSIYVLSRKADNLPSASNISHIQFDATADDYPADELPDTIDGLAYCPGTITLKPFKNLKQEDFQHDLAINFFGAIKVLQGSYKALRKADGKASVVLFSTVAVQQGMAFHASIAAAKGALEALARSLAAEWSPDIRVNCIAPSLTDTPLASHLLSSEDKVESSQKRHPLRSIGSPGQLADMANFLLNSDAAQWMTGQTIGVDGGMARVRG